MKSPYPDTEAPVAALIRSRQHLQTDPENTTALFEQAVALCRLGQWEHALQSWEQVTLLEPDNAFAHFNRGLVYLQQEQWRLAEQAFEAALRYAPEHAEAHFGLGVAYAQQERYESARTAWQEALRYNPAHPEAHANLAMLAQMSTTEVESLNFGSAQTMQFDCIATSQEPSSSLWQPSLPLQTLQAVPPILPDERRIKLPPLSGPPLGAIAEAIVAAQEARAQEADFARESVISDAAASSEEHHEPTLRLNGKALKREHARLRTQDISSPRQNSSGGRSGRLVTVTAGVVVIMALSVWGVKHFLVPTPAAAPTDTTFAAPPNTTASLPTPAKATQPLVSHLPVVIEPDSSAAASGASGSAPAVPPSTIHAHPLKTIKQASASNPRAAPKPAKRAIAEETPRPSRRHHESSDSADTADSRPTPRRPAKEAKPTRPHPAWSEEDTFAAHRRPTHANNAEEWTDHIP